jgi:hypothetical protein
VFALCLKAKCDLDRGHRVTIGILLGVLSELCIDGVLPSWYGVLAHLLAQLTEMVVDLLDDYLRVFTAKEEVK